MRFLVLLLGMLGLGRVALAQVTIDNIDAGDEVRYPVVALHGASRSPSVVVGTSWDHAIRFPVVEGKWAGFVELKPGPNMVLLFSGQTTVKFRLDYLPMTSSDKVLAVFLEGSDGEDKYYTDQKGDTFPIADKLDVALKLMQSACAEAMNKAGQGRKTFHLETDPSGKVIVHFVKLPKTEAEMRAMEPGASWAYIYDQLKQQFPEDKTHWLGVMGFATFDPKTKTKPGHFALGGGPLACFGAGSMGWWPTSFKDVPAAMSNSEPVDPDTMFEDSAYRQTAWAQVSTAYGAMLHELGHTFGLPHTADPLSVMSRGFDHFSRWFTVQDPPRKGHDQPDVFDSKETMEWDPFFAARLALEPWFLPDDRQTTPKGLPEIKLDGDVITLTAPDGIRIWGADRDDIPQVWEELPESKTEVQMTLSVKDLRDRLKTEKDFRVMVMDSLGQQANLDIKASAASN